MIEIWKDIKGFEGYYQISNKGNVKSLERVIVKSDNVIMLLKEKTLKICKDTGGYSYVGFSINKKRSFFSVHRLVCFAFIKNENNYPEVNHKDKNKNNNNIENLEWCTRQQNADHGYSKTVYQYDLDNKLVKVWKSGSEAGRNGFQQSHINGCCLGKLPHHKNYKWSYENKN